MSFHPRRWKAIRNSWVDFIPLIDPPGSRPKVTLSDFLEETEILAGVSRSLGKVTTVSVPRAEVPEIVFREATYCMHKALYVLGSSESHINMGMPTWSLPAAYQSAFFSARAIMGFLGVGMAEFHQASAAVDLCRNMQDLRPQRLVEIGAFSEEVPFHTLGVLFDHRQIWLLFQRVLRVTSCDIWPSGWANYLSLLDVGEITRQRHGLHYQVGYWVTDDLHQFIHPEDFPDVLPTGTGRDLFDNTRRNFSFILASIINGLAIRLFEDLGQVTTRLSDERTVVYNGFSIERHPLFADQLKDYAIPR